MLWPHVLREVFLADEISIAFAVRFSMTTCVLLNLLIIRLVFRVDLTTLFLDGPSICVVVSS